MPEHTYDQVLADWREDQERQSRAMRAFDAGRSPYQLREPPLTWGALS